MIINDLSVLFSFLRLHFGRSLRVVNRSKTVRRSFEGRLMVYAKSIGGVHKNLKRFFRALMEPKSTFSFEIITIEKKKVEKSAFFDRKYSVCFGRTKKKQ